MVFTPSLDMLCGLALDVPKRDAWREQDSVERETHGVPQGGQWFFRQVPAARSYDLDRTRRYSAKAVHHATCASSSSSGRIPKTWPVAVYIG